MNNAALLLQLRAAGLVTSDSPRLEPLTGGVSSEIFLVTDDARRFVVKRALAKLNVPDDWFADTTRNAVEHTFFADAFAIIPESVPRLLGGDAAAGWFAMEYFGDGFSNWKKVLLAGAANPEHARRAGTILGKLHRGTWDNAEVRRRFATLPLFQSLRLDPYLRTTAARVPEVRELLEAEARRLASTSLALVHGDYSPKNLLVSADRVIVLDAEVAWFGDPAFDTAFLLNHLLLKALFHRSQPEPFLALVPAFWSAYIAALGPLASPEIETRTTHLLLCLLLARVHGKSPAEYLMPAARSLITSFAVRHLHQPPMTLDSLTAAWHSELLQK